LRALPPPESQAESAKLASAMAVPNLANDVMRCCVMIDPDRSYTGAVGLKHDSYMTKTGAIKSAH
jgi:hypothetical protein